MIKVLPLKEDLKKDKCKPYYMLSITIGHGEYCHDAEVDHTMIIDNEKAKGKNLLSYESKYNYLTQSKAEEIYKFFHKILKEDRKYEDTHSDGKTYEYKVDHILLNDGPKESWHCKYSAMTKQEFEWFKKFYERYEISLLQPEVDYNWYGIIDVNIYYIDEDYKKHDCEVI